MYIYINMYKYVYYRMLWGLLLNVSCLWIQVYMWYAYTYIWIHIYIYINTYIYVYCRMLTIVLVQCVIFMDISIYMYMWYVYTYISIHIYTYINIYIYIYCRMLMSVFRCCATKVSTRSFRPPTPLTDRMSQILPNEPIFYQISPKSFKWACYSLKWAPCPSKWVLILSDESHIL